MRLNKPQLENLRTDAFERREKKLLLTDVTQSCVGCSAVGRYHASTWCFHRGTEKAEGWCCLYVIKRRLRAVGWLTDFQHDSVCYLTGSPSSFVQTVGNVEEGSDFWALHWWGLWKWKSNFPNLFCSSEAKQYCHWLLFVLSGKGRGVSMRHSALISLLKSCKDLSHQALLY